MEKSTENRNVHNTPKKNVHDGHRDRMRYKYIEKGADAFEDHEILEILLYYGVPRKNTNDIAHELLNVCGSISSVFDTPPEILTEHGISFNAAFLLNMIPDLSRIYLADKFDNTEKYINEENVGKKLVYQFAGLSEEYVYIIFLNAKGKEIYCGIVSKGNVNSAPIYIKKIVTLAARCNAVSAILSHNHPSGIAFPSKADISATCQVHDALKSIGVKLIDHIIVSDKNYFSLASTSHFSNIFE